LGALIEHAVDSSRRIFLDCANRRLTSADLALNVKVSSGDTAYDEWACLPVVKSSPVNAFKTIALVGKYQSQDAAAALGELAALLHAHSCRVLIEESTAISLGELGATVASYDAIGMEADLVVVVGGDGTMLNTARRLARFGVPLVGVNQGRLGFMTDIARDRIEQAMRAILAGDFSKEDRLMLSASVMREGEVVSQSDALNDVVLNKGDLGRMIEMEVKVDGELIHVLRADGLIISTPTGSTAYALSANGPILHPAVAGIAIVPLCPHALSNRPITVSDASCIEIGLIPPHDARIHFDGQTRVDAPPGTVVRVQRSPHPVTLIHPPGYSYFSMLRQKLHWSSVPRS
jgi:NAD+ kinase